MNTIPELQEAAEGGLRTTDLFVGMRVRYENMEGDVEANPDYNPYANMEDYASGRLPAKCIYKWVVRSGTDGFYPESVLAHGGKLYPTNALMWRHGANEMPLMTHRKTPIWKQTPHT